MNGNEILNRVTWTAIFILAIGIFTSVTLSGAGHIVLIAPALFYLFRFMKAEDSPQLDIVFWSLLAFTLVCMVSVVWNLDIVASPGRNIFKTKYFVLGLVGVFPVYYLWNHRLWKKALFFFVLATTVASLSGLIAYLTGFNPLKFKNACHPYRACGLYGMYMTYGYGVGMFMIITTGLLIYKKEIEDAVPNWLLISSFVINGAGLALSLSRGAWIGYLIAVPFFFFKKNVKAFLVVIASGVLILGASIASFESVRNSFYKRPGSDGQRIVHFKGAIKAFQERPILGFGYKNYEPHSKAIKEKYKFFYKNVGHAHNNYLEHLASTGVLGLGAMLFFFFAWLRSSYKRDDLVARITFPFLICFFVSGFVQYSFGDGENLFLIMSLFSIDRAAALIPRTG